MAGTSETEMPNPLNSIWSQLDSWGQAEGFKPWQQFVLANAVRTGWLTENQIDQAYQLFLQDHGLLDVAPDPPIDIPEEISGRPAEAAPTPVWLQKIGGLRAINALPESSELTFSQGLTVVYGENGVGKSGFTRILSNVCFSRTQHHILPNVYAEDALEKPSAKIVMEDGTQQERVFHFDGSSEHPELRRIAVFDAAVAHTHLVDTISLEFKPSGFDVFPEMARVYTELNKRLITEIKQRKRENTLIKSFVEPESPVSNFVAELNADTDLVELRQLAAFGKDEEARLEEIKQQLKKLRSKSVVETVQQLQEAEQDFVCLQKRLLKCNNLLNKDRRARYRSDLESFREKAQVVAAEDAVAFKRGFFKSIGTPEWVQFLAKAKTLARLEREDYPRDDDHCLMCHRHLDAASADLIRSFWDSLESESRSDAEKARAQLDQRVRELQELRLDFLSEGTTVRYHLTRLRPELSEQAVGMVEEMDNDRNTIIDVLRAGDGEIPSPSFESVADNLAALVAQIKEDIRRLKEEKVEDVIKVLEEERIELRHRQVLNKILEEAEQYVVDLGWAKTASGEPKRNLNTQSITTKEKELFARVIARDYKERLSSECNKLGCSLPVEFRTQGRKGETLRSLRIRDRQPDAILSEGEQRVVALADFLTEVSLNPANAGIVLDDPVTSQDHERKKRIACRLVSEAKDRQVIIFTHDLVFLTMIICKSKYQNVEILTHWIQRDGQGNPGQVSLDDCPAITPQYHNTKKANETLDRAKKAAGSKREKLVQRGMGELRRTVEEIIPHHLFKQVVTRWDDRIMVTSLKKVHWDEKLIEDIISSYTELSSYIEGHSHTEARTGGPPKPSDLEKIITQVNGIINRARQERKNRKLNGSMGRDGRDHR